jgi:hypothetical protein
MDRFDQELRDRARCEPFELPGGYAQRVRETLDALEEGSARRGGVRAAAWVLAAALAVFVALPNLSAPVAYAMEEVPVLGDIVRVITWRSYAYDDGNYTARVDVPRVESDGAAAPAVNEEVRAYIDRLLKEFEADREALATGHEDLLVTYRVVTDTQGWFTLRVDAARSMASTENIVRIYHIDKASDRVVALGDLFAPGADYVTALTKEVKRQMRARMEADEESAYLLEVFEAIDPAQSFYWNEGGGLTLVFDAYAVAPGYMGEQEFVIPEAVLDALRD